MAGTVTRPPAIVVVGAGLAAGKAVESLRGAGYGGPLALLGAERHRPYERPPLSKGYLLDDVELDSAYVHAPEWYAEHDVDRREGVEVVEIDRAGHAVRLDDGSRVPYGTLLLATGAEPRELDVPGGDLSGVMTLRTIEDSRRLRSAFRQVSSLVVIGGGWIGMETAAAARTHGLQVTVLDQNDLPLQRVLGTEAARMFADLHREHGVTLRPRAVVTEVLGDEGAATGVRLADGSVVEAELVVAGIGARPRTGLAEAAGLDVADGIVVDEHLRTSDPAIFAAGDVANAWRPGLGRQLRIEHWANAIRQGELAGRTMLGHPDVDERSPYFFTDQYEVGMEYTGWVEPGTVPQVVIRGDLAAREAIVFWLVDGRVVAGMNVNVWDVADAIDLLVRSGRPVHVGRLADPDVPLERV